MNRILALLVVVFFSIGSGAASADTARSASIVVNADDDTQYVAGCQGDLLCAAAAAMDKCQKKSSNPAMCRYAGSIYGMKFGGSPADSSCTTQTTGVIAMACQNPGKVNAWCFVGCGATAKDANYKAKRNCEAVRPDRWECHVDAAEGY